MSDNMHVTDLLPAYVLGCLDEEEATQVRGHLATCAECRAAFDAKYESYARVVEQLALAAPDAVPPSRVRDRMLGRLQASYPRPEFESRQTWWQRLTGRFQGPSLAWGAAALILLGVLIASNVWWWQRGREQERRAGSQEMQVVAMAPTGAAPGASGLLIISADGEYGTLIVDGLPALDADHQYQLWLIRDGQRTSGGVFAVNPEGYGSLPVWSPEPLSSYAAFGVTVEPAGGSPGPTGEKVLGGGS